MQGRIALVVAALVLGAPAAATGRNFDDPSSHETGQQLTPANVQRQDTPNDPEFDRAELDDEDGRSSTNLYDERFDLFGFPSALTPEAVYLDGPNAGKPMVSGYNAAGAWKLTRGSPDVSIAILDTGIKWDRGALRKKVRLNRGELPLPQRADGSTGQYDLNGDGAFDVDDYSADARVSKDGGPNGVPGKVDAQDLIAAFSNGTDADGNAYVDDIAGWDFFGDDNDPFDQSSYFAAANHGSGRAAEAAGQANDGDGGLGVCPRCQLMPLRVWDTFVSDQNSFALAVIYAADNGAAIIEGADGGLYHSDFAEAASQYAYDRGAVQVYSGDDLNTGNHNYPANYDHTMLIQGTVPDTVGIGTDASNPLIDLLGQAGVPVGTQLPVKTYFRGAATTQYGGHSSISMEGATGSENTGKASGAAALVVSAAREHGIHLRPDETRAILEQTAEDVTAPNTVGIGAQDQAQPGWDPHFGWGRVNLGDAVSVAASGKLPPEASIDGPDWFAPLTGDSVSIDGLARARFASGGGRFHWKLEWGPGLAPTSWTTAAEGDSDGPAVRSFGRVDLAAVRAALRNYTPPADPGMPTFLPSQNPYQQQFAVRLTVTGNGIPTPGVDRKVLTALDDPSLEPGFPKRMGAGGEAPLQYADVDGDNVQELVVPLEDGTVHVYRPDGSELPGWPVRTGTQEQALGHLDAPGVAAVGPPREPPRAVAVADLDDDGQPELITTAGIHVYVWEPDGSLRDGFPVSIDRANCRPQDQRQELVHRKCGFLASPALARLRGPRRPLSIVVPGLDGHLYALDGDGHAVPGFPVDLADPGVPASQRMLAESINNVAVGDLNGDGRDDVVAASNEVYGAEPPSGDDIAGLFAQGLADLLAQVTNTSTRVYAIDGATGKFLHGWPIKLNGGIQNVLPLIGPGHDPSIVRIGGQTRIVVSATGGALSEYGIDGKLIAGIQQSAFGPASNVTDRTGALNLFESASIGDVTGSGMPTVVKYQTSLAAAANLLLVGQNFPWQHAIGAWDARTGAPLPAFPTVIDDYQFLSSSSVAKLRPGSSNQIVAGSALGLLHAYDGVTGLDVAGFPKVTGGWLFAPAALARDGQMAGITREGFLFRWRTGADKCQSEWPDFRHDPQHSGAYGRDGWAPGAASKLRLVGGSLDFQAPGDDGLCGTPARYQVARSDSAIDARSFDRATPVDDAAAPRAAGDSSSVPVPSGSRYYAVRAIDEAGNVGPVAVLDTGSGSGADRPGGSGAGTPDGSGVTGAGVGAGIGGDLTTGAGPGAQADACAATAGFHSASARPADGGGLAIAFAPRASNPVTVEVLQTAVGRRIVPDTVVARFAGRRRGFTWSGRVADGYYVVKMRSGADTRRIGVRRSHGRFHVLSGRFDVATCGTIESARLSRPVFGGPTSRPADLAVRLGADAPITVEVTRGGKRIRTLREPSARAGHTYRFALDAHGLRRGDYTVRIRAGSASTTLTAAML